MTKKDEPKDSTEKKPEFFCTGPLCSGNRNTVCVRGTYCSECNNAISSAARSRKFGLG